VAEVVLKANEPWPEMRVGLEQSSLAVGAAIVISRPEGPVLPSEKEPAWKE